MKSAIALICFLTTTAAYAQEVKETTVQPPIFPRKNDVGFVTEMNVGSSMYNGNLDFQGIQYKRWVKPNMGYRVIGAFGQYSEYNHPVTQGKYGDTVVEQFRETKIPQAILGLGVEMQRKFYKRVVLFAALELRGTYGRGKYRYVTTEYTENNPNNHHSLSVSSPDASVTMFSVMATPTIGAKIHFPRWGFGTELSAIQMELKSLNYAQPQPVNDGAAILNMDMGNFKQRFFVYFRF